MTTNQDDSLKRNPVARLRGQFQQLSKSQQKVAEHLLTHGLDVMHYTVAQLAEKVGVNASTVVRMAQAVGYDGYPEMQAALRDYLMRQSRLKERLQLGSQLLEEEIRQAQQEHGNTSILQTVLRQEMQNLLNLTNHVPIADYEQAVEWLDSARQIYILGLGSSYAVALNFGNILRYVLPNAQVLTPGIDPIAKQLEPMGADDLLFSISFARYMRDTLTTMDLARRIGAKVITVTDSPVSPAAQRADLPLIVPYRLWLYGNSVAMFALLNAILGALVLRHPDATEARLEHLEFLYETYRLFDDEG